MQHRVDHDSRLRDKLDLVAGVPPRFQTFRLDHDFYVLNFNTLMFMLSRDYIDASILVIV